MLVGRDLFCKSGSWSGRRWPVLWIVGAEIEDAVRLSLGLNDHAMVADVARGGELEGNAAPIGDRNDLRNPIFAGKCAPVHDGDAHGCAWFDIIKGKANADGVIELGFHGGILADLVRFVDETLIGGGHMNEGRADDVGGWFVGRGGSGLVGGDGESAGTYVGGDCAGAGRGSGE